MTKVSVTEYATMPKDSAGNVIPISPEPPLATQTIDYSAGVASITLGPQTRYVRLNNDTICAMRFDGNNAAITDSRFPAETIEFKGVQPGGKISAITTT